MVEEEGMVWGVRVCLEEDGIQAVTWEKVKMAASGDKTCRGLIQVIRNGFPEQKSMLGDKLTPFYSLSEELYEVEEVPFLLITFCQLMLT